MSRSFDRWFNLQAPVVPADTKAKRELWHRLEDRLHQRRQDRRRGAMGLVAVLVLLSGTTLLKVNDTEIAPGDRIYRGNLERLDEVADQEFWETAAEDRVLSGASFTSFEGRYHWSLVFDRSSEDAGGDASSTIQPWGDENTMTRSDALWLAPKMNWIKEQIVGGRAQELAAQLHYLSGYRLWFRVYRLQTERGPLLRGVAIIPADAAPTARP